MSGQAMRLHEGLPASVRPTCLCAQGLPTHHLGRVHGPVELPAEVLAVVHMDVVVNVLVHHVRLKHWNSYFSLSRGSFHTVPSATT